MHDGQSPGDLAQRIVDVRTVDDERGQPPVRWHPSHHHEVVAQLAVGTDDIGHPEVHIRSEAAVQRDLLLARLGDGPIAP